MKRKQKEIVETLQGNIEQYQIAIQEVARMSLDELLILHMQEKHLRKT